MMMALPEYYQNKHSFISGSYSQDVICDYSKARNIGKSTEYYLSVSLGFLVRVRFGVFDY